MDGGAPDAPIATPDAGDVDEFRYEFDPYIGGINRLIIDARGSDDLCIVLRLAGDGGASIDYPEITYGLNGESWWRVRSIEASRCNRSNERLEILGARGWIEPSLTEDGTTFDVTIEARGHQRYTWRLVYDER